MLALANRKKKSLPGFRPWDRGYVAMLYVDASVLQRQDMATPKEMVDARLDELGMSKTQLMRELGYKTGYADYHTLFVTKPHQLTDEKLAAIARILKWPENHFKDPAKTLERAEYIRREFQKYLRTEIGRSADPETHRILESMQWTGKWLPSVTLYQAVTLAMEGRYTAAQLLDALELEAQDRAEEAAAKETQDKAVQKAPPARKRAKKSP